ncbi:MAG: CBS domain-containing protein [Burkholderiales bacterium]
MKTVRQLLAGKSSTLASIGPDAQVVDALKLLAQHDVGALLVTESGRLVGILSERDYARKVVLLGKNSTNTPVREIMTEKVISVGPGQTSEDCMAIMTAKRIRHLPVLDNGKLVGVLSIGDLVKETIADQQDRIQQLESYIHS